MTEKSAQNLKILSPQPYLEHNSSRNLNVPLPSRKRISRVHPQPNISLHHQVPTAYFIYPRMCIADPGYYFSFMGGRSRGYWVAPVEMLH